MGKAMDRLNKLRDKQSMLRHAEYREEKQFGAWIDHDSPSRKLYENQRRMSMERLDREIQQAEKEAFAESLQEARQAMLKGLADDGTKVGKEIANAISKGLNGR